jgi:hypothetical protein
MRSRRVTGLRLLRQALAPPHPGPFTARARPLRDAAASAARSLEVMMIRSRRVHPLAIALVVALAVAASACAMRSPSIADLKYNPGRYYDRSVYVEGVVTSSWGVPMVPLKMYRVGDGSGDILVVSDSDRVPPRGARVRVRGHVTEFGNFGGRSIGMHLREESLHVKRRW